MSNKKTIPSRTCNFEIKIPGIGTKKCGGNWVKHGNPTMKRRLCDNPECRNYSICKDCGKKVGTHYSY